MYNTLLVTNYQDDNGISVYQLFFLQVIDVEYKTVLDVWTNSAGPVDLSGQIDIHTER